ncbi:hypothetical protein CRENBAI_010163 [Crenichthys baileyi]|uniref:Uncharacterized protein n=1 Tax=Crenichthys baileyi TaxID=28760 RepID=A0AAV9RRV0_9TELE
MMAGRTGSWKTFQLLFIFSLLNITKGFEVKEDDWEELSPDIAALHRLKGLSEHMFHKQLNNSSDTRFIFLTCFMSQFKP